MLIIPLHIRQISSEIMNGEFRGRGNFLKSVGTQPPLSGKITSANQITTANSFWLKRFLASASKKFRTACNLVFAWTTLKLFGK